MEFILEWLSSIIISVIGESGYLGIAALMFLEGSFLPVPSEIILPFSGYLVFQGKFNIFIVAFIGAVANIFGTLVTYSISRYLGLPFLYKYGRYMLISRKDIDGAHRLFEKYGTMILFASRLLPGVRGYVPIPAGIAKMDVIKFIIYVFSGSFIWSYVLTYAGVIAGENWDILAPYFRKFDWAIVLGVIILGGWWIWRHIKNNHKE